MQNRYVGDIGDYSKFVLIKNLFDGEKVGIIWYLYPNEGHNNDGKFRDYENYKKKLKNYKIDVIDIMKNFSEIKEDKRNIQQLENELEKNDFNLTFFSECIDKSCNCFFSNYMERENHREKWFENALKKVENCDIVFADPDNGIEIESLKSSKRRIKSGKYIFFNEIEKLLKNYNIVIIYQHFIRKKQDIFINEKEAQLRSNLRNYKFNFYAIKFKKISTRAYLILSKENLRNDIEKFCNKFQAEFELIKKS